MAKAQKRGNKEAKKPKKVKEPVAAPSPFAKTASAAAGQPPKKKG
jgi:hypothetical protein